MSHIADNLLADVASLVNGYRSLESKCCELEQRGVNAERFYNWAASVDVVASMHSVSPYLVRKYIELGMIETHPNSTPTKFLIRGSVALMLDFRKMREEAKYLSK